METKLDCDLILEVTYLNFFVLKIFQGFLHFVLLEVSPFDINTAMLEKVKAVQWQHLKGILHDISEMPNGALPDGQHVANNPVHCR